MNELIIEKIDRMIDAVDNRLIRDTIKYVNIKSVAEIAHDSSMAIHGAPFGEGTRRVLDEFLSDTKADGFFNEDYGVGVVSSAIKEGARDLGIWLHGDVVDEGDNWSFEPYNAIEYKGCVIGRGATDNKGQLVAILNLFRIFKEIKYEFNYNPAIYLGSNEEGRKYDLIGIPGNPDARGFLNVCTPPKLSLVPDSGFPLGYGGKGGMNITLKSKTALEGFTFIAGRSDSPGSAIAEFSSTDIPDTLEGCTVTKKNGRTEIYTFSPPRHASSPDPNGNMITILASALIDNGLISGNSLKAVKFFKDVSVDIHGELLGIRTRHTEMGNLTVFAKCITCADGYPEISLSIRYPLGITYDEIISKISARANEECFEVVFAESNTQPYITDPDSEIARILTDIANSVTGDDKKPYILSGSTYAHLLPNAYVYGMSGCLPPEDFPAGRGGAHGVDEAVSIERLKRAMRIYARALIALNSLEW